jgi:nuclear pore complex protein Nup155
MSQVDAISETLQQRCGSFCSADDVLLYKVTSFSSFSASRLSLTDTLNVGYRSYASSEGHSRQQRAN